MKKDSYSYRKIQEELNEARDKANKIQTSYIKDYALENSDSYIAAFYMNFQKNEVDQTFDEYEKIVEGFDDNVKKSDFYEPLKETLDKLKNVAIGKKAPDFTLKNDKGDDFTLSSLIQGKKVILIDFWASWCIPAENPFRI